MSAVGSVVVGFSYDIAATPHAFRWTQTSGMHALFEGGLEFTSSALGISADGLAVVGQTMFGTSMIRAFRWTATGMQNVGSPDSGGPSSHADAITPDGSVVVGAVASPQQAVSWTAAGGMRFLGALPGALDSAAYAVSADGGTIVGTSGRRAFVWRQGIGIEDLQTLFAPLAGWTFTEARGISADGTIFVGNGSRGAWIATFPCLTTVPEVDISLVVTGAPRSTISWGAIGGRFNVYRGSVSGGWWYNQTCFDPNTAGPSTDPTVPAAGSFSISSRAGTRAAKSRSSAAPRPAPRSRTASRAPDAPDRSGIPASAVLHCVLDMP